MIQQNMDDAIRLSRSATWHVVAVSRLVATRAAVVYAALAPAGHHAARRKFARVAEVS
jgi:acetoin utilization deacetylase AcuC-like enzyme